MSTTLSNEVKQSIDKKLKILHQNKLEWRDLSFGEKLPFLKQIMDLIYEHRYLWSDRGNEARKTGHILEELIGGCLVSMKTVRYFIDQYECAANCERKGEPVSFLQPKKVSQIDGQFRVQVYPNSFTDGLILPCTVETWVEPGCEVTFGQHVLETKNAEPKIGLVLGAGNYSSIVLCDTIHKLFYDNEVVFLKHNPIADYMYEVIDLIFAPLIERGFFQHCKGAAAEGQYLVEKCDTVHITGSDKTHDIIVWGMDKSRDEPLKASITSELGCVTPILICPVKYTDDELNNLADVLVNAAANNCGFNCNSPKIFLTASGWDQREEFWEKVRDKFALKPVRFPYYPGAFDRYKGYTDRYDYEAIGECGSDRIPWTIFRNVDWESDDHVLRSEPFCPIVSEVVIEAHTTPQYLREAVEFSNEKIWGNLSCCIFIGEKNRETFCIELDRAISNLRYGCISINAWSGLIFFEASAPWGAFSGNDLRDVQSGIGFVHNGMFVDNIQKCVLTFPKIPKELKSNQQGLYEAVMTYVKSPSLKALFTIIQNGIKAKKSN